MAIDIETYGSVALAKSGVYRYAEAGDFEILLFGYAFDDEPAQVIDLASGAKLPGEILSALSDPRVIKTVFNANFERTCLEKYLNLPIPSAEWHCSMAHALYLGLPASRMQGLTPSRLQNVRKNWLGDFKNAWKNWNRKNSFHLCHR